MSMILDKFVFHFVGGITNK